MLLLLRLNLDGPARWPGKPRRVPVELDLVDKQRLRLLDDDGLMLLVAAHLIALGLLG